MKASLQKRWLGWGTFVGSLLFWGLSGCQNTAEPNDCPCAELDGGRLVDPVLMAFLGRARAAHHIADDYERKQELPRAIEVLEELVSGPIPGGTLAPMEAREVVADTRARLADLSSRIRHFEAADRHVAQGLSEVSGASYFVGHLYEVRGRVEERRAEALAELRDQDGANRARARAVAAFEKAMEIQAEVIKNSVGSP